MLPILPKIDPTTQYRQPEPKKVQVKKTVSHNKNAKENSFVEKTLRPLLPKILVLLGVTLILSQVIPLGISVATGYSLSANSSTFLPVTEAFMQNLTSVKFIDPGVAWFEAVVAQNHTQEINTSYKRNMKLSIPNAGINRVTLAANVPGNNATLYDEALKHGVAHLKGTSVPGDPGLSVVYGHSGLATFLVGKSSPQIVFSRLDAVSIGDTMSIDKDGKEIRYVVSGKKIIEPEDLNFMGEQKEKERAILLTCWPLGIGTKRLIIIADRIQ
jgi:LPXTG-site transpeptidase (sortase) family protein